MSAPSKSLNCQLAWTQVLPALQVQLPRVAVLPQTLPCPLCGGDQFIVTDDGVLGGAWNSCRECGFAGDLVELAAGIWSISPEAALAKLDDLGLFQTPIANDDVAKYMRDHVEYRRRLAKFWELARRRPMRETSPSLRLLLRKFGLMSATQCPSWLERAGRFIGGASRAQIEELFSPLSYDRQERSNRNGNRTTRRGGGPGKRKLFRGHGWEDLLVVPYYDLPGRICGFLFVGREGDPEAGDFIYKRANLGRNNRTVREAGVAMLPALHDGPDQHFGDIVFVVADPVVGLLLQTQRMRESTKAFPVVVAYFSQEIQTLRLPPELEGRRLIFWGDHPKLLSHAKRHNGIMSRYTISHKEVERRLNHRGPLDWLRLIRENAVPWIVALRRELRDLDLESARRLVARMNFTPGEMRRVQQGIGHELQARLLECDPDRLGCRRVQAGGKTIVETEAGWEIEATGETICNMPLRIEEVVTTDEGDRFYRCFVPVGDGGCHFTVRESDVDRRGLFACARDELLNQEVGVFTYQPRWSKHAAFIAMQIREPEFVTGVGRIGWERRKRRFWFPRFSIAFGGDTNRAPVPLASAEELPASHLEAPTGYFGNRRVQLLSGKSPEIAVTWATMACIAHNLLAAAGFHSPSGVILDGEITAAAAHEAARALGCTDIDLGKRARGQTPLQAINIAACQHDWPVVVRQPERMRLAMTAEWLDDPGLKNAFLTLEGYSAVAAASHPGFVRIHSPKATSPLGELRRAIATLMPAWLQDACERKLWIDRMAEHEVFNILDDIARWYERHGGDAEAVRRARKVMSIDSLSLETSFVRVASRLYEAGEITATRPDFDIIKRRRPAIVYGEVRQDGSPVVWVPADAINQILAERRVAALNLSAIEEALKADEAWLGEYSYRDVGGWVLDRGWWDGKISFVRSNRPIRLSRRRTVSRERA